jgi:16S rRNA (cytosine1402-N4)-methyltransferase
MVEASHQPVLFKEIIHALQPHSGGLYVDGTVGAGGHASGLLDASAPKGKLLGFDLDPLALALAYRRLASYGERAALVQASYTQMKAKLAEREWGAVDGIVIDLGISSMQIDTPERGFSFLHDAPLDMRFSPVNPKTAAEIVNQYDEIELADILFRYGEERMSRRIAKAIIAARPIETTKHLSDLILKSIGKKEKIHPATRTFQALRIAVNGELQSVEEVLPIAISVLKSGGRLAVISFHSLEDRIVKDFFRLASKDCICPPKQPVCTCGHKASIKEITRKPIVPMEDECKENPRARSAKLRVAERL